MHFNQVAVWRRRYEEFGLTGLVDEERSGRPVISGHDDVLRLVETVTEAPPDSATRWTMEALAARMAEHGVPISASQVWRICRALDLKPWQTGSCSSAARVARPPVRSPHPRPGPVSPQPNPSRP